MFDNVVDKKTLNIFIIYKNS